MLIHLPVKDGCLMEPRPERIVRGGIRFSRRETKEEGERERKIRTGGGTQNAGFLINGTLSTSSAALGKVATEEEEGSEACHQRK
jgi:hypothetical protein